ncbi:MULTISPECIES: adenosylcobinamide-GDP ribazoletransferase [Mesorhizobium]|uniref:Adenosylcobinamide-GDP ribazoletransferase n=1 Tax=Mesorhizobium denitrificans TaxID=2294114 RepID=A0A371XFY6_9HYPH|nr:MULTISPECIES: adenosylcobinamide-GDP ribazoletransferase [Mesorhizobium]RFC68139.1 adenosylcobinamide-GDP ribazoletransferase [Mesorhizobium denitrificans]
MRGIDARSIMSDLAIALVFFTRLPLPHFEIPGRKLADALWAAPIVGMMVALAGGVAYTLGHAMGINEGVAAAITLAVTMFATGCLHEDGLADTADAFGGGRTIARKLEIMRDSRIGTYGAAALVMSVLLRWTSLASLPGGASAVCALLAAHAASRGVLAVLIQRTPAAREDGLGASVGTVSDPVALAALGLGALPLLLLGIGQGILMGMLVACIAYWLRGLFIRQVGGITGDTLGAAQQVIEIAVLVAAGAILS